MRAALGIKKDAVIISLKESEFGVVLKVVCNCIRSYAKHDTDIYMDVNYPPEGSIMTLEFYYRTLTGRIYVNDYNFLNLIVNSINKHKTK